ncbi:hypothetical protein [Methylobrevis pamukkalensis]|uniref:Uncharacterized protein n=1 Tax=Methylobrevis pamukkalensis TaxID=1439726 RepID=A0A1E3H2N7_9HYPH|nr:hypothetical protein [Methylobrevis pamukkalensis]ODN69811.1 hypothetical protein A6302_02851 [Methylobrevis pamukkalensis]
MAQLDMFAGAAPAQKVATADPDRVRRKLAAMLDEARDAGADGLPLKRRRLIETLVPQMTRWLPDAEAEAIRQAFGEALAA